MFKRDWETDTTAVDDGEGGCGWLYGLGVGGGVGWRCVMWCGVESDARSDLKHLKSIQRLMVKLRNFSKYLPRNNLNRWLSYKEKL